ncbi:unnamed protein product [Ixodes pacificus]
MNKGKEKKEKSSTKEVLCRGSLGDMAPVIPSLPPLLSLSLTGGISVCCSLIPTSTVGKTPPLREEKKKAICSCENVCEYRYMRVTNPCLVVVVVFVSHFAG